MKNLQSALRGMLILAALAALFMFYSCSAEETGIGGQGQIENTTEDESEAKKKKPPVTKNEDEESQDMTEDDSLPEDEEEEAEEITSPDLLPDDFPPYDGEFSFNIPAMLINELRTEYDGSASALRAEFIELKMLSQGNLGGLRVFIASNTKNPLVYQFKPVDVKEGEYVLLHLRTLEESCKDEYGGDLSESGGKDAPPDARDFWIPGKKELLRKTDAVYIMDMNNVILDAVMLADDTVTSAAAFFNNACEFLFSKGAWLSPNGTVPCREDAVKSSGIKSSMTRSISRDENAPDTNTAADWHVTGLNGVTAGRENSPRQN